jgi:hypothetical protein
MIPSASGPGSRAPGPQREEPARFDRLPPAYWTVPYAGSRFPGSPSVTARPGLETGANCQLFAYAVLGRFGLAAPPLRSSELWDDTRDTLRVPVAEPLDLLLFNGTDDAYGAHVGVGAGGDRVLHLCAEVGRPAVWTMRDFAARDRYRVLVGVKRVITRTRTP